ncbi:MAG: AAA family ATPase [Candidatus Micrarchaeia archaeon]
MKPYMIRIASQKGGVGKTTIAVNLAAVLVQKGYDVLLVDADTTNPACAFHLGMEKSNSGYYDIIKKKMDIKEAISIHAPSGIHVLNGRIDARPFVITFQEAKALVNKLSKSPYDFIILDTQPGFYDPKIAELADEVLFITNPDMPSCMSTIKLSIEANNRRVKHALLINRVQGKRFELNDREIADMYEGRVIGKLPEDPLVQEGIAAQIPIALSKKKSPFVKSLVKLAEEYTLNKPMREKSSTPRAKFGLFRRKKYS